MALVNQVAGCNAIHPVSRRLCRWILQTRDRTDNDVFPMTQEFLSEMLGVQRTSVTMLAHELQNLGLIKYPAQRELSGSAPQVGFSRETRARAAFSLDTLGTLNQSNSLGPQFK